MKKILAAAAAVGLVLIAPPAGATPSRGDAAPPTRQVSCTKAGTAVEAEVPRAYHFLGGGTRYCLYYTDSVRRGVTLQPNAKRTLRYASKHIKDPHVTNIVYKRTARGFGGGTAERLSYTIKDIVNFRVILVQHRHVRLWWSGPAKNLHKPALRRTLRSVEITRS